MRGPERGQHLRQPGLGECGGWVVIEGTGRSGCQTPLQRLRHGPRPQTKWRTG
jgi:hypothetical protein